MDLLSHLWTLTPRVRHAIRPVSTPPASIWTTTVDDEKVGPVHLAGLLREEPGADELVLLVHGLGGAADSHYMRRGAVAAAALGLSCLRLDLRGAGDGHDDFYHAGLTADLHAALASPELAGYRTLYVLGYSLGGHVVLRYAAEPGDPRVRSVAAVCAPIDLARSEAEIDGPGAGLYRRYLVGAMVRIYERIAARRPLPLPLPLERVRRIRTIREWDELVVAPRHGFAGADDYYERASAAPLLPLLRVPSLLLNSSTDPMVPAASVRPALPALPSGAPNLTVRFVDGGGHVGFPRRLDLGFGGGTGLDAQVMGWLRGQGSLERKPI